jgi:hypothetical protein
MQCQIRVGTGNVSDRLPQARIESTLFSAKEEARKKRADLPIAEKLKIVERLRDASRLIKNAKEIPPNKNS